MCAILKCVSACLVMNQGIHGLKTFKPILKEQNNGSLFLNQGANDGSSQSDKVKAYKKRFTKIVFANILIIFISCLYARNFFINTVDKAIDQEYDIRDKIPEAVIQD